jgi:hypothetical protein
MLCKISPSKQAAIAALDLPGLRMHVAEAGSGEPVLLLLTLPSCGKPERARAASALYRHLVLPESQRIIRGSYRGTRLRTPTFAALWRSGLRFSACADKSPALQYQAYADHVEVAFVAGAAHFSADGRPDVVVDRALKFFAGPSRQVDLP